MRSAGGAESGWRLVQVQLQGGAPWGFTLQGGLEHGEPLVISKVEEGGKAECLERPLLTGDEIIVINEVELSGYRQEAIALVKGSHKTLQLTVRREFDAGYMEDFVSSPASCASSPHTSSPTSSAPQQAPPSAEHSQPCLGVQLRFRNRRSEPPSRPHSWHSAKLGDGHLELDHAAMDTTSSGWHHNYHTSASTVDLSPGFDSGVSRLRKSPDQYSSRGSMESLDPPLSSQLPSGAQHRRLHPHLHPLDHHNGSHQTYSSCHQLSSGRSSNSIDHLHSKRDSAYSSFSTSSSIPEYLASTPSFRPERSYSLETVPQRGGGVTEVQQADLHDVQTLCDNRHGVTREHELSSGGEPRAAGVGGANPASRDRHGPAGGVFYPSGTGGSYGDTEASNRHSIGSTCGPAARHCSYESLKGGPAPPRRSDSYAAIRNHERPNSWCNLDHSRSLRSLQKGSWHHSSGSVASGPVQHFMVAAKGWYGTEGQLHTVMEKSPESSPTTKPRQGGFPQPLPPPSPRSCNAGSAPSHPSGRPVLPSGVSSVLKPEPHCPQTNSSNPSLGPIKGYPASAKEGRRQQQPPALTEREDGVSEGGGATTENGHLYRSYSTTTSTQLRAQANERERETPEVESESQTRLQRPWNDEGSYGNSIQEPSVFISQPHQEQNHYFHSQKIHAPQTSQDVAVHPWGERSRSVNQTSMDSSDHVTYSRPAQGHVPQNHTAPLPYTRPSPTYHPSDPPSAATRYQHSVSWEQDRDREHPLTRLENALAEVQQCNDSDNVDSASSHDGRPRVPVHSLSVLEKVSRIERREQAGKPGSHSASLNKPNHPRVTEKGRSAPCGAEDLRHMLERSTKAHRTMSYRAASSEQNKRRTSADPSLALQRSQSTLQVDASSNRDSNKDIPWRQEIQDLIGPIWDMHTNRSYRDCLKDAQSKVLCSTSFKRRDLTTSVHSPPPAALSAGSSSSSQQPPPVPVKYRSIEKKGPKTMPKPQGTVNTPQAESLVSSPHTPKERHVVSPDVRGPSPPALPTIPPVGAPAMFRICGRKRLTADQKKRSYSEPENMNEVGVSDAETVSLFRRGGESSVADRRKIFELVTSRLGSGTSKPDLRQVQQDALAEYVERKRTGQRADVGHRLGPRPHSAYLGPESSSHTDTLSLSSTSSLLSLQDTGLDHSFCSPDRQMLQSNLFYPGRVTTPRPPAQPRSPAVSSLQLQDLIPEAPMDRRSGSPSKHLSHGWQHTGHPADQRLQKTGSVSAENLVEPPDDGQISPQHHRSCSSPSAKKMNQDLVPGEIRMFGVFTSEPGWCARAGDSAKAFQPSSSSPGPSPAHTAVPRRERQRNGERQRALSASTLAASVGLPCPFSPPWTAGGGGTEWQAGGRLSQANLDSITFPQIGAIDGDGIKDVEIDLKDRQTRHSVSVTSVLEEMVEPFRVRAFSLETRRQPTKPVSSASPSPQVRPAGTSSFPPQPQHPSTRRLSSLRISDSVDQKQPPELSAGLPMQVDLDEVFLLSPPGSSPSPLIKETSKTDDFSSPPTPVHFEQAAESCDSQVLNNSSVSIWNPVQASAPVPPLTVSALSVSGPPPQVSMVTTSNVNKELTALQYLPLTSRIKTPEELRVDELSRNLVLLDPSLAPVLGSSGEKSTVDIMEKIFTNCKPSRNSQHQLCGHGHVDRRIGIGDIFSDPATSTESCGGNKTHLDEDEKDLNARKVELCEALKSSIAALQREKEALCEEQRGHQALGASLDTLVQERLKPNERDKFRMFIGDLDKIVNLLLSLCGRLSRIDKALLGLQNTTLPAEDAAEEKESLDHKRSLLLRQTEDACELKENLDRRQRTVHAILSRYLLESQLQDYCCFVSARPSSLMAQRRLDDLLRQEDERLARLLESLSPQGTQAYGRALLFLNTATPTQCSSQLLGMAHSIRSTTVTSL